METFDPDRWQSDVLDQIFEALGAYQPIADSMVFKGARVLNLRLGHSRQSLDIDGNLSNAFAASVLTQDARLSFFEKHLPLALARHFDRQEPVRFTSDNVTITRRPKTDHPRGWDGFVIKLRISDQQIGNTNALPDLGLDINAPEPLSAHAIAPLKIGRYEVQAYTLQRIAAEKLRAFLTSLPSYRAKVQPKKRPVPIRTKDLHDLARICRTEAPAVNGLFWRQVAEDFQLACQHRFVDCEGFCTFQDNWDVTRADYRRDPKLSVVDFVEAEAALHSVMDVFSELKVFPLVFPLPAAGK